jgi:YidC/Oxa1 family membrane protein insertase
MRFMTLFLLAKKGLIMDNQKTVFLACLACLGIWLGSEVFLKPKVTAPPPVTTEAPSIQLAAEETPAACPPKVLSHAEALNQSPRISIQTPLLKGSLALKGARFDDLTLKTYHQTTEENSPPVTLLSPENSKNAYYAYFLWYSATQSSLELPTESTVWSADHDVLTVNRPVTLSWKNSQGIDFQLFISVDDHAMITVKQTLTNTTNQAVSVGVRGLIDRKGPVQTSGYMVLYEGPLGVFESRLKEVSYKDCISSSEQTLRTLGADTRGSGWLGITDKYWLMALIPGPNQMAKGRFSGTESLYRAESVGEIRQIPPQSASTETTLLFSGPKQLALLDHYEAKKHINHFDLAVDFGWFYFLTKPMFYLLSWLKQMCGSFGMAILLMTVMAKIAFFPLALRSHRSMGAMRSLQPKMQALREKFKEDRVRLNEEMMALYRKEKVNPASGCLPMLLQIPVFFALYKVLFISIEMRHAPFLGWIKDLSSPDPTSLFNGFGLFPWDVPEFLHVGAWPLLMGATMYFQQRSNSMVTDPTQRVMFLYVMPLVFSYMMANFPVGLVIYWSWSNLLTLFQQWVIQRRFNKQGISVS